MSHRYFRTADDALYESVRLGLDDAWGLPAHGCTCYAPALYASRDAAGRLVLAANVEFCEYESVAAILPGLLASGAVEEIDRDTYMAAVSQPTL